MRDLLEEIGTIDKKAFLSGKRDLLSELKHEEQKKRGGVTRSFELPAESYWTRAGKVALEMPRGIAETAGTVATGIPAWGL